ncbi:hypothetical protein [Streptomyces sp. NPDC102476]|uniref:hypothetical protein n=1 Tax=Streptomyces sp. NPDC102476 TaxID=3366181 RepID=UPI0037FACDBA
MGQVDDQGEMQWVGAGPGRTELRAEIVTASFHITASAIFRASSLSYDGPGRWRKAVRCRLARCMQVGGSNQQWALCK